MKYPLPGYAATIWYNGDGYTILHGTPDDQSRTTYTSLHEAEEFLQHLHRAAAAKAEIRLRGTPKDAEFAPAVLEGNGARVEFDMTGGYLHQLTRPMSELKREELRRLADDILRKHKPRRIEAKAKTLAPKVSPFKGMSLEDLGL